MTAENKEPENHSEIVNDQNFESTEIANGIFLKDEKANSDGGDTFTTSFTDPHLYNPQKGVGNAIITSIPPHNTTIAPHLFAYPVPPQLSTLDKKSNNTASDKKSEDGNTKSKILSPDERRQRRLLRNRLAAKDCRKKKKEYILQMEETITRLESQRAELRKEVSHLKDQIAFLPAGDQQGMMNSEDNYKLMKEVEKLNAKLGNHIK
ncbi:unnamed protein product [Mucor hiemalis]